jgi:hypothetical protein
MDETKLGEQSPTPPRPDDEYEPVEGLDQKSVQCVRACEAKAAEKTASDYEHIVWAYGVIWSLFAAYGVFLWRKAQRQRIEVADLQRRLDKMGR